MDLDSLITFLLFLAFFVLPSIIRMIRAGKKKSGTAPPKEKKTSFFGRVTDRFAQVIRELEEQVQQAKQQQQGTDGPSQDFWQTFKDDEWEEEESGQAGKVAATGLEPQPATEPFTVPPEVLEPRRKNMGNKTVFGSARRKRKVQICYKRHPLQNAVVWSEILGKPKALRNE
jgi:hypothetical protein